MESVYNTRSIFPFLYKLCVCNTPCCLFEILNARHVVDEHIDPQQHYLCNTGPHIFRVYTEVEFLTMLT